MSAGLWTCLKAPSWFTIGNRQIHNDTGIIPLVWIKTLVKKCPLKDWDGARGHYNVGSKTHNRRLRARSPQDILLTDTEKVKFFIRRRRLKKYKILKYVFLTISAVITIIKKYCQYYHSYYNTLVN